MSVCARQKDSRYILTPHHDLLLTPLTEHYIQFCRSLIIQQDLELFAMVHWIGPIASRSTLLRALSLVSVSFMQA